MLFLPRMFSARNSSWLPQPGFTSWFLLHVLISIQFLSVCLSIHLSSVIHPHLFFYVRRTIYLINSLIQNGKYGYHRSFSRWHRTLFSKVGTTKRITDWRWQYQELFGQVHFKKPDTPIGILSGSWLYKVGAGGMQKDFQGGLHTQALSQEDRTQNKTVSCVVKAVNIHHWSST